MIAIDTQILVYAHRGDATWHVRARDRLAELATSNTRWGIPVHCLVEFYATVTRGLYTPPSTPEQAIAQVDAWLESPSLTLLSEDANTWSTARDLLLAAKIVGVTAYDARIAAVCLEHGVTELWTNDRDYLKFPALRVRNPLIDLHPSRAGEARGVYQTRTPGKRSASASGTRRSSASTAIKSAQQRAGDRRR